MKRIMLVKHSMVNQMQNRVSMKMRASESKIVNFSEKQGRELWRNNIYIKVIQ